MIETIMAKYKDEFVEFDVKGGGRFNDDIQWHDIEDFLRTELENVREEAYQRHRRIEFCEFLDEVEVYLVIGPTTEEEALAAIHEYEKYDHGLDEEDFYSYPLERVRVTKTVDTDFGGHIYYNWEEKNMKNNKGVYGWLGKI